MHHRHGPSPEHRRFAHEPAPEAGRLSEGHRRHEGGHGPRERGEGERGRRGGPGRRVFDHGELRLVVLGLIAEKPRHGYEIIKAIEDRLAGTYSPSPGVIYPTLALLDELGHVALAQRGALAQQGESRKPYAITAEGTAWLDANRTALDATLARMDGVRAAQGNGPAPAILRATENLKLALRLRLGRGPLDEEQVRIVAAALDEAATAIERS